MGRRPRAAGTLLLIAVMAFVAACGPNVPKLTDPAEILDAAATNAEAATSVHLDASVEGTVTLGLLGGGPVDLSETTASADLDLGSGDLALTFSVPAILGLAGDVVVIGETAYYKTTLTGADYQTATLSTPPGPLLDGVIGLLRTPDLGATLGEDEACAGGTCYAVSFDVSADDLGAIGAALPIPPDLPIPLPDLSEATVHVTVLVEQSNQRLAGIRAEVAGEGVGDLTVEVTFTKWDEPVTIEIPEGAAGTG